MEAQLQPPSHGRHRHDEDPHSVGLHSMVEGEGEHDHHGEKKSVLKKVKAKAKKIKDTITKHGHEHEHEYRHDQMSEEEDDHDEEMENDPEVHGASMVESTVIRGTNLPKQTDVNLEKPTDTQENRYNPNVKTPNVGDVVNRTSGPAVEGELGSPRVELRQSEYNNPLEVSHNATRADKASVLAPTVKIRPLEGLEEDPQAPKSTPQGIPPSNHQTKVVDPTGKGGREVDVAPLVRHFDGMNVHDKSNLKPVLEPRLYTGSHDRSAPQGIPPEVWSNPESNPGSKIPFDNKNVHDGSKLKPVQKSELYTGSHDQFAPQGIPPENLFKPEVNPGSKIPETASEGSDPDQPDPMPADTKAGQVSSMTSLIAGKAAAVKNLVASSMIADKAAAVKNLVALKLGYGDQGHEGQDPSKQSPSELASKHGHEDVIPEGTDKGVSVKEYLVEKLRPGDEDKALSEAITEAFHKKGMQGMQEEPLMGKVKVSEEVATNLGTRQENRREGEDAMAAGSESSGAGVVDRLKDAVGSWLGKSTGTETAKNSVGQAYVSDAAPAPVGSDSVISSQGRLQESGN